MGASVDTTTVPVFREMTELSSTSAGVALGSWVDEICMKERRERGGGRVIISILGVTGWDES